MFQVMPEQLGLAAEIRGSEAASGAVTVPVIGIPCLQTSMICG
jgi:hypothetical protein